MAREKTDEFPRIHATFQIVAPDSRNVSLETLRDILSIVKQHGSLTAAASFLGRSYRYVWGFVKEAEHTLSRPLVHTFTGGKGGGGAGLTEYGVRILEEITRITKGGRITQDASLRLPLHTDDPIDPIDFDDAIFMACTLEVIDSGFMDVLERMVLRHLGIRLGRIGAGSGTALELGKAGRVEATVTHAPELERQFVREGWGEPGVPFMRSRCVILGPKNDPAGVRHPGGNRTAVEAFERIARGNSFFVTRGDNSGTRLRELRLWDTAGVRPDPEHYIKPPEPGNRTVIQEAARLSAYTLVDLATIKLMGPVGDLEVLWDQGWENETGRDPVMDNQFVLTPVLAGLSTPHTRAVVDRFVSWTVSHIDEILAVVCEDRTGNRDPVERLFIPL
jgi:tungstate transport system substrate-binding protein